MAATVLLRGRAGRCGSDPEPDRGAGNGEEGEGEVTGGAAAPLRPAAGCGKRWRGEGNGRWGREGRETTGMKRKGRGRGKRKENRERKGNWETGTGQKKGKGEGERRKERKLGKVLER